MRKLLLLSALGLLILSCRQETQNILVYTDTPEAVVLLNQFNNTQSAYTAEILFNDTAERREDLGDLDLILAKDIQASSYFQTLANLNFLRETPYIENVYPEILLSCIDDKELKLIPLSVEIPLILFSRESYEVDPVRINRQQLEDLSLEFNRLTDSALNRVGFSPLWSSDFLFNFLASGTDSFLTLLEEPDKGYSQKISYLQQWIEEKNNGYESIEQFGTKYMYIPDYRLLMDRRIGFSLMRLTDFMLLPDSITGELDFRLYVEDNRIQPLQMVSAGIRADAPNPEGAEALIRWLLQEETWEFYLNSLLRNRDRIFGLNGLSANYRINETLLTETYPALKGRIPYPGEFGRIPLTVPQWNRVREEVLIPHTRNVLSGTASVSDLTEEYRKWLLLNPDPLTE